MAQKSSNSSWALSSRLLSERQKTLMELADSDGAESGDGGTAERRRRNVWNSSRPRIARRREGTMGRRERDCAL